ncbi:DUF3492 domain-containing protein [Fodinibius salsisoli]|uniref:DUF3492 domain-containing protein n=1 Tax=Fodinibius salsisoli TaxID=2820877 RepID=A0ABT3PR22_9BACT|nr:DUF3492 domain-containing protein [Fodinibius salsisoli]MCW9708313.1 DUF3492 domain-containing protein [Fodinibius salsisoli]
MKKNAVLLVIEGTYPWYRGGVSEWVHQYLRSITAKSFNILQVATDQFRDMTIGEALYNVPSHVDKFERIPPPDLTQPWKKESKRWFKEVKERIHPLVENSEIVHIANTGTAGWLGKEVAQKYKKPLLLTEHALYWKEIAMGAIALECGYKIPRSSVDKQHLTNVFRKIAAEIYGEADKVVSVSRCNVEEQQTLGAQNVEYIPNGISANWLLRSAKQRSQKITIGWIGRCAEMKNPMKFFEVIDSFETENVDNVQFLMLSCDADEPKLEKKVKHRAQKYPKLTFKWNRSTENYIDQMDALCITSHNESQPLVLFEALSRKVLPIGWQAGDVTDQYGLILENDIDTRQLVKKVMALWETPEQWQEEVQQRFLEVEKHHVWNKVFDRYKDIFSTIIKH